MQRVTQEVIVWRKEGSHRKRKKALFFFSLARGRVGGVWAAGGCWKGSSGVVSCGYSRLVENRVSRLQRIGGEQNFNLKGMNFTETNLKETKM